jgi:hypothetical protein
MDFVAGQGAKRRHSRDYGKDEQHACLSAGCHAAKGAPKEVPLGCAPKKVPLGASFYIPLFRRQATSYQRYNAKRRDDSSLPLFFAEARLCQILSLQLLLQSLKSGFRTDHDPLP